MATQKIEIGSKVNYSIGSYMKNGIVYGLDIENNRAFVKWDVQGNSSINLNNLIVVSA